MTLPSRHRIRGRHVLVTEDPYNNYSLRVSGFVVYLKHEYQNRGDPQLPRQAPLPTTPGPPPTQTELYLKRSPNIGNSEIRAPKPFDQNNPVFYRIQLSNLHCDFRSPFCSDIANICRVRRKGIISTIT